MLTVSIKTGSGFENNQVSTETAAKKSTEGLDITSPAALFYIMLVVRASYFCVILN